MCDAGALIEVMKSLYQKGLITVLSGNASVRCGKGFLITPSGVPKNKISELAFVDLNTLGWSGPKPSIEYRMHAEIYKNTDAGAVVHAHNPKAVLAARLGAELDPEQYVETKYAMKRIAFVPELEAGSSELAEAVGEASRRADVVILKGHGAVAWGRDPYDALNKLEALEYLAELSILELSFNRPSRERT
ncbi:MAG: class II aldolase/adducin family protein [Crenarchaeota archaeon]|nr:class II aldolase/adducin family protein [Thermoproteota archaeon]